jgi:hypothetical protein
MFVLLVADRQNRILNSRTSTETKYSFRTDAVSLFYIYEKVPHKK